MTASDGTDSVAQTLTVNVTEVDAPPIDIALTNSSILEVSNFNDPVLVGSLNSNIDEQKRIIDYIAFMQARHPRLERISEIIGRMSQLKALSGDITKSPLDIAGFDAEFNSLQLELGLCGQQA